jgi:type II secretory pathway component GspD/PulD (secretin)
VGEKTDSFEVLEIKPPQTALIRDGRFGTNRTLTLPMGNGSGPEPAPDATFNFHGVALPQVLEVYQRVCGRTVISPTRLSEAKFTLQTRQLEPAEAAGTLEKMLRADKLAVVAYGEKFVFVVSPTQTNLFPLLPDLPESAAASFPPGLVRFASADVTQVLEIYSHLTGKKVNVRDAGKLPGNVTVTTQTPMSRADAIWLLDASLLMTGVRLVPEGDTLVEKPLQSN